MTHRLDRFPQQPHAKRAPPTDRVATGPARARSVLFERALGFIEAAKTCKTIEGLSMLADHVLSPAGVARWCQVSLLAPGGSPSVKSPVGRFHPDWVEQYVARDYAASDIVLKGALATTAPRLWSYWRALAQTAREREVFDAAAMIGSKEGYVVPVHHRRGDVHAVIFSGAEIDTAPSTLTFMHLVAIHFHAAVERIEVKSLAEDDRRRHLTERQLECLKWVAVGKSDWEIGEILGLSENTVHRHVERAKERLDVRTRAQAIMALLAWKPEVLA
jgi:DNA-binding CsgD family transcriptional regulator